MSWLTQCNSFTFNLCHKYKMFLNNILYYIFDDVLWRYDIFALKLNFNSLDHCNTLLHICMYIFILYDNKP